MINTSTLSAAAATKPSPRWHQIASFFQTELRPQPGRLRAALVRVAGTVIAMWVGFALNVPEMGAVLAFAFFGSQVDKAAGRKVSFGVPLAILVILLIVTAVEIVFGISPLVRFITMFAIIYACLFLLQAAENGGMFLLAGVFGKLFLTFWDNGYPAEAVGELQLWIVFDLALAGLCALLVSTLFGDPEKSPTEVFREKLAGQFDAIAKILNKPAQSGSRERAQQHAEALSAPGALTPLLYAAAKKDKGFKARSSQFSYLIRLAVLLQNQCLALTEQTTVRANAAPGAIHFIADRCKAIASSLKSNQPLSPAVNKPDGIPDQLTQSTVATVTQAEDTLQGHVLPPALPKSDGKPNFFKEDAFTNPIYKRNAFRVLLASLACYCLMSGAHWGGIGTSISTCLITALTTTSQARQKQALRILGASIGAVFTILAMVYVLPHGDITVLTIVTAVITFVGAWVFAGSPRLNYAGVQIVLCFFLGTFGEDKTPTSLTTVRDRVVGIFIGNLAMWLFYDRIQPSWTVNQTRSDLANELTAVGTLVEQRQPSGRERSAADLVDKQRKCFQAASVELRAMADPNNYEFKFQNQAQRDKAPQLASVQSSLEELWTSQTAAVEARNLGIPLVPTATPDHNLSARIQLLVHQLKAGASIRPPRNAHGAADASPEGMISQVEIELTRLFS